MARQAALATLSGHTEYVYNAAFSPDGARIVTASGDHTARLRDAKTGATLAILSGWDVIAFSPDSGRILTEGPDHTLRLWDGKTGAALATLSGHSEQVNTAAFSPDGARIVSTSFEKTARLWDGKTGGALATLSGHRHDVTSATFSPDGAHIVSTSFDNTARIRDVQTSAALATLSGHSEIVTGAAYSPDGGRIVTRSNDNTVRIWDAKTGVALAILSGHRGGVRSAAFSTDGGRIVTASNDGTAKIWDVDPTLMAERSQLRQRRKVALAALNCDEVEALDARLGGDTTSACAFDKLLATGAARELYLAAVKYEADKERAKAKRIYLTLLDRFPQDDFAVKAGDRITALADVEAVESSNAAAVRAAAEGRAAAEARAQTRAAEQQRNSACSHVYIGKEFRVNLLLHYRVVGFSAETQRVTIREDDGTSREISCSEVPQ